MKLLRILLIGGFLLAMTTTEVAGQIDIEAPMLIDFELSAETVNVGMEDAYLDVTVHAADDLSGIVHIQINILPEKTGYGCGLLMWSPDDLVSGTELDGIYESSCRIPQHSEPGRWFVSRVRLEDRVGNVRVLEAEDLGAYDTEVDVINTIETQLLPLVLNP